MSLNFDEYETDVPEKVIVVNPSKVVGGIKAPGAEIKSIDAGSGINPQSSSGLGINPQSINATWNEIKPYVDPRHYKDNLSTDYENIDFPTSIAHGVADVTGAYLGAKGLNYGAGQMFPPPGVAEQREQRKAALAENKRLARGDLNPLERSRLAYEQAKTQQILSGLTSNASPQGLNPQAPTGLGLNPPPQISTQPPAPGAVAPTTTQPINPIAPTAQQASIIPTDVNIPAQAEAEAMRPGSLMNHLQNKYDFAPTKTNDLMIFANQATPSMKTDFAPELIKMMKQGVIPKPAVEAGVTPSTSAPEAETLVSSHEASLTPDEALKQKIENPIDVEKIQTQTGITENPPAPTETLVANAEPKQITPTEDKNIGEPSKEVKGGVKVKKEPFEGFKKLPGEERWLHGTWGANKNEVSEARSKELLNALKNTLPEGSQLKFPVDEKTGKSIGGMPSSKEVLAFTNQHLGTDMKLDERGKFPADFKYTEENLKKMHDSITQEMAKAKTPAEVAKAQKGFANLGMLAAMVGIPLAGLGLYNAYKEGKKTGDYTDLGMGAVDIASGLAGKAAVPIGFLTHMSALGKNEKEELAKLRSNEEFQKLGSPFRKTVNGGRGIAPPSAYR